MNPKGYNSINSIISIFLILIAIIFTLLNLYINNSVISRHLFLLEESDAIRRTEMVQQILLDKAKEMELIARDYAIWDDSYYKIRSNDIRWFQDNVTEWLSLNYSIDSVSVINKEGIVVSSYGLTNVVATSFLTNHRLKETLKQPVFNDDFSLHGITSYENDIYIIGFCPILKTDYSGPCEGVIVLATKITKEFMESIKLKYGYQAVIEKDGTLTATDEIIQELVPFSCEIFALQSGIMKLNDKITINKVPIMDYSRDWIANLILIQPRDSYISTLSLFKANAFKVFIISIILITFIGIYFKRIIVKPIQMLKDQIEQMQINNSLSLIHIKGPLEIVSLAKKFNRMTKTIIDIHEKEKENLEKLSKKDYLTSLYNHKSFYEDILDLIDQGDHRVAVLFSDLDKFKQVNSYFGHTKGDLVLKQSAAIIEEKVGQQGTVYRYGGEEFAVLAVNCNREEALALGEKIREGFLFEQMIQKFAAKFPITISIGIAIYPDDGYNAETVIQKADRALFYSKINGRNQCNVFSEEINIDLENGENLKKELLTEAVFALAEAVDAKDNYTGEHSKRIAELSLLIADKIGLDEKEKISLRVGALLHDCGKIGIPDHIIHKSGPFTADEFDMIKSHTLLGMNIIKHITKDPRIISAIKNHHERWDGSGYPDGLKEYAIPLFARIVAITDAYHAMISDRPYRKALTKEKAKREIIENKGIQFDPELADVFLKIIQELD